MLVVAVKPSAASGAPPENADLETRVELVASHLRRLASEFDDTSIEVDVIEEPGQSRLVDKIQSAAFDVVHYVGHGRFDFGEDQLAIGGSNQEPTSHLGPDAFASCIEARPPSLVVLQSCGGQGGVPADLSTFARPLLTRGSSAVVANQYPIGSQLTKCFNRDFYRQLAEGDSVEVAVQAARRSLFLSDPESRAFIAPTVFVRNPGGLQLAKDRKTSTDARTDSMSEVD
jgi:CHAT domain-containing protein